METCKNICSISAGICGYDPTSRMLCSPPCHIVHLHIHSSGDDSDNLDSLCIAVGPDANAYSAFHC